MALAPIGGGGGSGGESGGQNYTPIGSVRTFRVNNDGTFTPVMNLTALSDLYGVQFTFTILAKTFDEDGAPAILTERTGQVNAICGHPHVQGFWTEADQGPDQILYNYANIEVGTDDGAITTIVTARMDQIGDTQVFTDIDNAWKKLQAIGAS